MTQSAVSRTIAALERRLGGSWFTARPRATH
ncbi:MAG: LysR family transcriptional regulator [Pseudonocardiaceae bacterium]